MDVSMPVLDGFEATRAIRKRAPSTRVLFVTGSNAEEDPRTGARGGGLAAT